MSHPKALLQVLKHQDAKRVPIWLMRQAGRYLPEYRELRGRARDFLDFCLTPELAVAASLQPIQRYGFDGSILFSDILVIPHGLGQRVWFEDGVGPLLEPIASADDLERFDLAGMTERLAPVYETVRRLRQALPGDCALIGFSGAPWTLASYMIEGRSSRDFAKAKLWSYGQPQTFQKLIDLLIEAVVQHLEAQIAAGAEVVQIFDSWAGALDYAGMTRWSLAPLQAVAKRLKQSAPDVPLIIFPRGIGSGYQDFAAAGFADALSLDQGIDPIWARDRLQKRVVVQGNLDPRWLVAGGDGMRQATERIRQAFSDTGFVFNLGHGVFPETPPEHVAELVEIVRGWA